MNMFLEVSGIIFWIIVVLLLGYWAIDYPRFIKEIEKMEKEI